MPITTEEYNELRKEFIESQQKVLQLMADQPVECFRRLTIDCSSLSEETAPAIIAALKEAGISQASRVLYYMTFEGNSSEIIKKVKKLKGRKSNRILLPRLNEHRTNSKILYVGKTNSNFLSRMEYHLGVKGKSVYALHLLTWAKELKLKAELYFSIVELSDEDIYLLELLESVLHNKLAPILGREGH